METPASTPRRGCLWTIIGVSVIFIAAILIIAVGVTVKNSRDMQQILEESIESQLIAVALHARDLIDPVKFDTYNSQADADADRGAYGRTLTNLRLLADQLNVDYIYALKMVDGEAMFVFDTDLENTENFIPYKMSDVHQDAFAGEVSAGVMNVTDAYGSFNASAVPIYKEGQVIGIVAVDIADVFLQESRQAAQRNTWLLIGALVLAMGIMVFVVLRLYLRVRTMQSKLQMMAHYDATTGLPNRHYLLEFLTKATTGAEPPPFALLFIDLDNFKAVNDGAGHDAGDEVLRHIALYLDSSQTGARAFRPDAGKLNIAARIGGDEFIVIVSGAATAEAGAAAAEKLLTGFASLSLDKYVQAYGVGLSIGVALFPYHTTDFQALIAYADAAMYEAKRAGKNRYRVYDPEQHGTPPTDPHL